MQKQREVAQTAGITPAMLSAYETGKHRPSLDTTERVLQALDCDVVDLTNALQMVAVSQRSVGRDAEDRKSKQVLPTLELQTRFRDMVRQVLDGSGITPEEEEVLVSMLPGLLQLIRHLKS